MIDLINLSIQFDGKFLFEEATLKINRGDRIALVGLNGTGKSTLLKLINGAEHPEDGKIQIEKNISIGYLGQEFVNIRTGTVFQDVKSSIKFISEITEEEIRLKRLLEQSIPNSEEHSKALLKFGELHQRMEESGYYQFDAKIKKVLFGLGFGDSDLDRGVDEFSGGWQMRIELAKILLENNDIILLDEPTNHLDIDSLAWLINFLKEYKGSLIIVSHDRKFVNYVTDKTLEIFNRKITFYRGNLDAFLKFREKREEELRSLQKTQLKRKKEIERFIERFRYKASKAKQVQSRIKMLEKIEEIELESDAGKINMRIPDPPRSGDIPVQLTGIEMKFGENLVFQNVDLQLERGIKIAFVGPNGAGKTTLAKIISEKLLPASGDFKKGHNTFITYYAQEVTGDLNPENDLMDEISSVNENMTFLEIRSLLGNFMFTGDDVFKKIKVLSGGEKSRVALAKILVQKSNFIVLDEPTNHLDYFSKKILREALADYKGNLVIVSHDVEFLRPITDLTLDIREHRAKLYYGGIDYYLRKRNEEKSQISNSELPQDKQQNSRREQKRLEAEMRNLKFKETKKITSLISRIEAEVEDLETEKDQLEVKMNAPATFEDADVIREISTRYKNVKESLDKLYEAWEENSAHLEEIKEKFNRI